MRDVTEGIIIQVDVFETSDWLDEYKVGINGITKITREIDDEIGVAYIRLWRGDKLAHDFDQSTTAGIHYKRED